jgi:hypothetical protein
VSPVKYELGFYIPEYRVFRSHRRENLHILHDCIMFISWALRHSSTTFRQIFPVRIFVHGWNFNLATRHKCSRFLHSFHALGIVTLLQQELTLTVAKGTALTSVPLRSNKEERDYVEDNRDRRLAPYGFL